jgi:hypothetical protein
VSHLIVPARLLVETFRQFRSCGGGRRECQVLWTSPWASPGTISRIVHSAHRAHAGGFSVVDAWLNDFWTSLAKRGEGVRLQAHTHPLEAFHSATDDDFPIIQTAGFLSLVVPNFGMGRASLDDCYLCEMTASGGWRPVAIDDRITVDP